MKYFLVVLLLVAVIITAGCVNENKNVVTSPTPVATHFPNAVVKTTTEPQTATPPQDSPHFPTPKYKVGDVLSKEMPYYYQGFMISGYNEKTGKYSRIGLGRWNCGNGKYGVWYKEGGNNWDDMDASLMEGAYPIYLGHIDNPSKIPSAREVNTTKC